MGAVGGSARGLCHRDLRQSAQGRSATRSSRTSSPACRAGSYEVMLDRREAIFKAVAMAQPRDIILIAGKGPRNLPGIRRPHRAVRRRGRGARSAGRQTRSISPSHGPHSVSTTSPTGPAARSSPAIRRRRVATVCTDSRALKAGDLFVALRGENFDGHTFVAEAARRGALGAIVEQNVPRSCRAASRSCACRDTLRGAAATSPRNTGAALPLQVVGDHRQQWQDEHEGPHRRACSARIFRSRRPRAISTTTSACR